MIQPRVALTTLAGDLDLSALARVAAALQTQVIRDFASAWGMAAVVVAAPIEAIPYGYVPLIIRNGLDDDAACGFHRTRDDDSPYIIVPGGPTWSLAASHELLRMLADPAGSARTCGNSPLPGQGTVEYLVDVGAPCRDIDCAYTIDGVLVADFALPAFYGQYGPPGRAYSYTGALRRPFEPAPGGVVTWFADDRMLYQARASRAGRIAFHGGFSTANRGRLSLREFTDALIPERLATLSGASCPASMEDELRNVRRACLSNMMRLQDDMAWRFGPALASQPPVPARPRPEPRPGRAYVKSDHQCASSVEPTTERTAS